jgi:cytochrome c oxidase subunit II
MSLLKTVFLPLTFLSFNLINIRNACCDYASPKQFLFQDSASPQMDGIVGFHHDLFAILIAIGVLVSYLLIICVIKFTKEKTNNYANNTTHNVVIENLWTAIPLLIVFIIGGSSSSLLLSLETCPSASLTLKVLGNQWFWAYEYSDNFHNTFEKNSTLSFESYMLDDDDLIEKNSGGLRLLEVDSHVKLPTNTTIRVLTTSVDVLHCWAIPSLGIKIDSCPGRLNQVFTVISRNGFFYGQCSELCGIKHGFMPIVVNAIDIKEFYKWIIVKTSQIVENCTILENFNN